MAAVGEPNAAGIDFLIGEDRFVGKGLGPQVIRAYIRDVVVPAHPSITKIVSTPASTTHAQSAPSKKPAFRRAQRSTWTASPSDCASCTYAKRCLAYRGGLHEPASVAQLESIERRRRRREELADLIPRLRRPEISAYAVASGVDCVGMLPLDDHVVPRAVARVEHFGRRAVADELRVREMAMQHGDRCDVSLRAVTRNEQSEHERSGGDRRHPPCRHAAARKSHDVRSDD
ncbi:MAG: hypothetical protein JO030_09035 [Candidatus Eremiobacteraeota bacterium]|nr:hypothetical protein [Candidatus Eremiobacteraeota bacterium]